MEICLEFNGRTTCFPIYVEERHWPPIPPEDPFVFDDLVIEDPSWWRTAFAVSAIDRMADGIDGDFGSQLHQVAAAGMETLQAQLPEGVSLNFSTRVATIA